MFLKYINEPIIFQGRKKSRRYFEGWYFKQVSTDLKSTISIIPGVSKDINDSHAFIQTIINRNVQGNTRLTTHYHRFSIEDFKYTDEPFSLKIGKNIFKRDEIELELIDEEYSLSGKITFSNFTAIKTNPVFPNIMGYYAYLPIMECYHGIVSMSHGLEGTLLLNEEMLNFNEGKGYIEKDWGTSFPKEYVWVQSNNFNNSDASIMCSIANIPFLGTSFKGFICNLYCDGKEYRFASYNNSKLLNIDYNEELLEATMVKGNLKLELSARLSEGGMLKAPKDGNMNRTIKEGLNGVVNIKLIKNSSEILFYGTGNPCGIEIVKEE
ncbi:MAG: tocopherol cyclase family protein [Sedimentibacter sp.]